MAIGFAIYVNGSLTLIYVPNMNEDQLVMFGIVYEKLRFHFNFARRLVKFVQNLSILPSMREHCFFCNHNDSNSRFRIDWL